MQVCLITVFYHPSNEDVQSFLNLSKIFNYSYCFLNSKLTNSQKEALKQNSTILEIPKILGYLLHITFNLKQL